MILIMSILLDQLLELSRGKVLRLGTGEYLFHQGDTVQSLFLMIDGTVQLLRHQTNGHALILQQATAGEIIAEASLYAREYHCDAVVSAPASLGVVSKMKVLKLFRKDPNLAEYWAAHLARAVQSSRLKTEILSLKTVASRLDAWLTLNEGEFPQKGQWKAVASQIGVSPEALYREFAKRREE